MIGAGSGGIPPARSASRSVKYRSIPEGDEISRKLPHRDLELAREHDHKLVLALVRVRQGDGEAGRELEFDERVGVAGLLTAVQHADGVPGHGDAPALAGTHERDPIAHPAAAARATLASRPRRRSATPTTTAVRCTAAKAR